MAYHFGWIATFGFSFLSLTACGGGGGGTNSTPVQPPSQSVSVPATFQAAGTTVTYAVDAASAAISNATLVGTQINAAGSGSTVTVSVDSSGNLSSVSFNIATPSTRFTPTYTAANITTLPTLNLGVLAAALAAVNATSGANGFIGGGAALSGLSYANYGVWAQNSGASGLFGATDVGAQTQVAAMPHVGSATFNGQTLGAATSASASYALTGNVQLTANFASNTTSTSISGIQFQNLATNAVTPQPSLSGSGTITGNHYSGSLSGGSLSGTSVGSFYGPSAQETAGVWRVSGGGVTALGSYGAKQ